MEAIISGNDIEALIVAAEHGNLNTVKRILKDKNIDPSDQDNAAIKIAHLNGHDDVVYELAKHPFVREEMFNDCKDELTFEEAKFLLYHENEVDGADVLLEKFIENEDEFLSDD
jgi:hypothetical protein